MPGVIRKTTALAFSLALFLLAACGSGENAPAPTAPAPAPAAPAPPAAAPAPQAAVPASPGAGDAAKGAPKYAELCASCHGPKGCADGPLAASLNPKPAKHCDGNVMNALTDAYLFDVIKRGGAAVGKSPLMAPWGGTLSDAQIADVVAYVRTLANPPYRPKS